MNQQSLNVEGPEALASAAGSVIRAAARARSLDSALMKQARGVPFYTIPEAAVLLSMSQEHLYRLVRADVFPAIRSRGKYTVPALAVNDLVTASMSAGGCIEVEEWAQAWKAARVEPSGGAA